MTGRAAPDQARPTASWLRGPDEQRTGGVILINGQRTRAEQTNTFRGDLLISFLPVPGTVFYAGYGSTMEGRRAFRFRNLERTADGFFLKGSYLFRFGG